MVLLVLTLHWVRYNRDVVQYTNEIHTIASSAHDVPVPLRALFASIRFRLVC